MRIGIDARVSRTWETGVGRITTELVAELADRYPEDTVVLLRLRGAPPLPPPAHVNVEEVVVDIPAGAPMQHVAFARLPIALDLDVTVHTHPFAAPLWEPRPSVAMVLDVYPLLFPQDYPRSATLYYRFAVPATHRFKSRTIAISESTARDARQRLGLPAARITVVPLAAARCFRTLEDRAALRVRLAALGLERPYIVYAGNQRPHKNLDGLLAAYVLLAGRLGGAPDRLPDLVIAGNNDARVVSPALDRARAAVRAAGLEARVREVGRVTDDELVDLLNGALLAAVPSRYEGFGLPAIEAMACGAPVVAGDAGALPEVVAGAGLLVDPERPEAIAEACARIIEEPGLAERLSAAGRSRAATFSWTATAEAVHRVCSEVVA